MILEVKDLFLYYKTGEGIVQAVDGVSFSLEKGKSMVIVGESGCGKTSLGSAILRLLPKNVELYKGVCRLKGENIMGYNDEKFRREVRWIRAALVPQGAMNALNPVVSIFDQVAEPLFVHELAEDRQEAREKVEETFDLVGIPADFLSRYPFELSGGMKQRVALAMSLITDPDIIIMDEPTSALDMLTQANIMNVLTEIKNRIDISFILITHDVSTSSEIADMAAVMYAGQIVEFTDSQNFFDTPRHPYSKSLMESVPTLKADDDSLGYIPGQPPSLLNPPAGCRFLERCPRSFAACSEEPFVFKPEKNHFVRCWLYEEC
ncbi:oligopeptide/dipeptide ABC transporter ATP-binding protein [Halarsenatibacter silvermanii]